MTDLLSREKRSWNMSRIRSRNTKPELLAVRELKKKKLKFKVHYGIPGRPDIAFPQEKVAVFINGEFWHGRDFGKWKSKLSKFWLDKIGENIRRDRKNMRILRKDGWHVLNIWDKKVTRNPEKAVMRIVRFVEKYRLSQPAE